MAAEQGALFDVRPKERTSRRTVEPSDQALTVAITKHPELERQLRVIRQLCTARTLIITTARIVEHAGGTQADAIDAGKVATYCGWIYPYAPGRGTAWCPVLSARKPKA